CLERMTTYSGRKFFLGSTPSLDLGRSFTWPTDAFTMKAEPRYFLIVRALAGDSTTKSERVRVLLVLVALTGVAATTFFEAGFFFFALALAVARLPGAGATFSATGFFCVAFFAMSA